MGGNSVPGVSPGPANGGLGGRLGRPDDDTCGSMGGGTGETVPLPGGCGDVAAESAFTGGGRTFDPVPSVPPFDIAAFISVGEGSAPDDPSGDSDIHPLDEGCGDGRSGFPNHVDGERPEDATPPLDPDGTGGVNVRCPLDVYTNGSEVGMARAAVPPCGPRFPKCALCATPLRP